MSLAFIYQGGEVEPWVEHFKNIAPDIELLVWPEIDYRREIQAVVSWYHPAGELQKLKGLR